VTTVVVRRPGRDAWLLVIAAALVLSALAAVAMITRVEDLTSSPSRTVRGSGHAATEARTVPPFTAIDLAGTNAVVVRVGAPRAVAVTADDNLLAHVTTTVRSGRLVIGDAGSFTTRAPMRVAVSVSSLEAVELSGTGSVTVRGAPMRRLDVRLSGTGRLDLHDLAARDVTVVLRGTGDVRVHATGRLDATLTGTGSIRYSGHPTVDARTTGTGSVVAEPDGQAS
jgi:hypothetical protein